MTKRRLITVFSLAVIFLTACGKSEPDAVKARLGMPPAGFVAVPDSGRTLYQEDCAECHGVDIKGTMRGPALLHKGYRASHHADLAFYQAVKNGVAQHHWQFGNMPAMTHVTPEQAGHIVAYLRAQQGAAGIR